MVQPTCPCLSSEKAVLEKSYTARAIHERSDRKQGPFVPINCAAIPEHLLESELFGHHKGAFTGAYKQKKGKFEYADQGTLFLDEIGEIPLDLQPKLLRFLETQQIERVGGYQKKRLDVRILAATNRKLERDVGTGQFRGRSLLPYKSIHHQSAPTAGPRGRQSHSGQILPEAD